MELEKIFKLTLDRQFQISETISSKELEIAVYMYMTLSESVILKKKKRSALTNQQIARESNITENQLMLNKNYQQEDDITLIWL